jgi:hypothetical protein
MYVKNLEINTISITDEVGKIDWGIVINTPVIEITDNNHSHDDRYYRLSEVDDRVASLESAIDDLEEKVDNLFN